MPANSDHTKFAGGLFNRFSLVINYIFKQICFWIIAYCFLAILAHFILLTAGPLLRANLSLKANLIIALFFGFFNGIASGLSDQLFERRYFYKKALVLVIVYKAIISFIVFVILISIVRYLVYPYLLRSFFNGVSTIEVESSWESFFQFMLIYSIATSIAISSFNQVNKKYGPGVLVPLLLGKYRKPKEEERVFLFMDLKSSTSIAETLGHSKYSAFIQDSFMDINSVLSAYYARIYQYVGDEIVVTWSLRKGKLPLYCIQFFFACDALLKRRAAHYVKQYGIVPQFKAGLHIGKVIAVEVGEIKRDIAYLGDTVNTAARIQSICNDYDKSFLTSKYVLENSKVEKYYETESLGMIALKGKKQAIEIASILGMK